MKTSSERISSLQKQINQRLSDIFEGDKPDILYAPMAHPLRSGGKRIRPLMLLLSVQAVGGKVDNYMDAAAAIELLHTFTLVHDDIMDHDDTRRGQPTVHKKWDESTAILAGDGLVTLAYQNLLKTPHTDLIRVMNCFTEGLLILCEGQARDKAFETLTSVSLDEYMLMIEQKTAKLLEVSCEIGGILGSGNQKEVRALRSFAHALGVAFQIQDDLLDVITEETIFGKPRGSDLIEKKKTYLTIHFLNHAGRDAVEHFNSLWGRNRLQPDDIEAIRILLNDAGTIDETRSMIHETISSALTHLKQLKPSLAREDLETFAIQIRDRVA